MIWRKQVVDERVRNAQNKIYREVYNVITLICCISIAVKFITIGVSFEVILTEFIILIGGSSYYGFRSTQLGLFSDEVEMHDATSKIPYRKKTILYGIIFGLVIALFMGINSAVNYADSTQQGIYYFFLVSLVSLFIYVPFLTAFLYVSYYTTKKKSDKVNEKNLEDPDEW
ncbi:MAG: DUF6773 family protein [Solibacillus sp.]